VVSSPRAIIPHKAKQRGRVYGRGGVGPCGPLFLLPAGRIGREAAFWANSARLPG
jgi:hypothetical protein